MAAQQSDRIAVHWFRRDLRIADNSAFTAACRNFDAVVPLFVFDDHILERGDIGIPRVAFLLRALDSLTRSLAERGVPLVIRHGDPTDIVPRIAREAGATAVFANRDYSPYGQRRDRDVASGLKTIGVDWSTEADLLLVEPWECLKKDEGPYTVFTPYARKWRGIPKCEPVARPRVPNRVTVRITPESLPTLGSLGFTENTSTLEAGETAAAKRLKRFVKNRLHRYQTDRNFPDLDGTSGLSADLKFGTISPRQVHHAVAGFMGAAHVDRDPARPGPGLTKDQESRVRAGGTFISELCWRDFYQSILFHFPRVARGPFRRNYENISWPETRPEVLQAWVDGNTGFPIIDAGMRQLANTGWMHNRLRMLTACFLTKTLLVDWRVGERIFMQRLVDGDLAANNGGWQWCASTGTDAQPYFRIFNPLLQSKKFDPDGDYIRRWVPELASVRAPLIHEPSRDPSVLAKTSYPPPCVDYAAQRKRALELLGSSARTVATSSGRP